jgi:DNA modification methylase
MPTSRLARPEHLPAIEPCLAGSGPSNGIKKHTNVADIVFEPFSGTGSQIIAAERTGRRCRAIEITPAYVDVAIRRWEKATGQEATLDGDGRTFAEVAADRASD